MKKKKRTVKRMMNALGTKAREHSAFVQLETEVQNEEDKNVEKVKRTTKVLVTRIKKGRVALTNKAPMSNTKREKEVKRTLLEK